MFRLKEKPPVAAMDFVQCVPDTFKAAFDNKPDGLVMRAAVFCTIDDVTYLLLLKRAETDSLPGRWELPGGGVDPEDATIKDAVARELAEETGLTFAWIIQEVGSGVRFTTSGGKKNWLATTFLVEVDEIGKLEHADDGNPLLQETDDAGDQVRLTETDGEKSPQAARETHGKEPHQRERKGLTSLEQVPIKLSDAEHSRYIWATEEVVEKAEFNGERLNYVSKDMKTVLLQAFDLQKHVIAAKANM